MDITQKDRDALRLAQHKLNPSYHIGKIVEHKIQDPKKYKSKSREEEGLKPDMLLELPRINYVSTYLHEDRLVTPKLDDQTSNDNSHLTTIVEDERQQGLPINIEDVHANMWLNMDTIELDKVEWMSSKSERVYQEKFKSGVYFNQDGLVLDSSKARENASQVHDIESLIKLLDSTFQPQITYALNVISKIANLASLGFYDASFDQNIHQILIKDCLLRVRHHLDNPNETICQSALKCLRSLVCNTSIDEIFLDRSSTLNSHRVDGLWSQNNGMNSGEFDDEMKDVDCVENDAILALVIRTDLLTRFTHLLKTKLGEHENTYFTSVLDILVRIARHSREMCFVLANEGFPDLVIKSFLPAAITIEENYKQLLTIKALKFIRIIATAAREFEHLQTKQKILIPVDIHKKLGPYYYLDCLRMPADQRKYLIKIHIECLRLMRALASLKCFTQDIYDIILMDLSYLNTNFLSLSSLHSMTPISSQVSMDWQYAASLIDLTGTMIGYEKYHTRNSSVLGLWGTQIGPVAMQWLHDLIQENTIPHIDVSITLSTIVGHVKRLNMDKDANTGCFTTLKSMLMASNDQSKGDTNAGLALFNHLLQEATNRSHLCDIIENDGRRRDPSMLPSFGCLNFNTSPNYSTTFNSVIDNKSPFVLLEMYVSLMNNDDRDLLSFLNSLYLNRYLRLATRHHSLPLYYESKVQQSMMAQNEVFVMGSLILLTAKYYLQKVVIETDSIQTRSLCEPAMMAKYRSESYSQFFFQSISLIGLMNPTMQHSVCLKDQLLEEVILNHELHLRLADQFLQRRTNNETLSYQCTDHKTGEFNVKSLELDLLKMLKPIYLSTDQPGRFWIFQPLIDYYKHRINDVSKEGQNKLSWFATILTDPIGASNQGGRCSDEPIICAILKLNATLMLHSQNYYRCCILPNLEEYLCLVGSIFLDDNGLFLDPEVNKAIKDNIFTMLHECPNELILFKDATKKIETLGLVLADFFNKIVDQYEAASYGDVAFSNFLLLFLNYESDKIFKRTLFSDRLETCLAQVRLSAGSVWAHERIFFKQKEQDIEIIGLMKRAIYHLRPNSFLEMYCRHHIKE